jgi:hypothetical protein
MTSYVKLYQQAGYLLIQRNKMLKLLLIVIKPVCVKSSRVSIITKMRVQYLLL